MALTRSDLTGKVQTVTGLIDPDDLGQVLMHEHLFIDLTPPHLAQEDMRHEPLDICNCFRARYGQEFFSDEFRIESARWLVEQHDVRLGEQHLGEQHAQLPARRDLAHGAEVLVHGNAHAEQQIAGAGFGGVAVQLGELGFQLAGAQAVFLGHLRLGVDGVALLLDLPQFVVAHDHRVHHGILFVGELVLAQFADALVDVLGHVAGGRVQVTAENLPAVNLYDSIGFELVRTTYKAVTVKTVRL